MSPRSSCNLQQVKKDALKIQEAVVTTTPTETYLGGFKKKKDKTNPNVTNQILALWVWLNEPEYASNTLVHSLSVVWATTKIPS